MNLRRTAMLIGLLVGVSATVWAQPRKPGQPKPASDDLDIRKRFGKDAAERMLTTPGGDRIRALRRLTAIGTPQAIDAIVQSQNVTATVTMDVKIRVEAIRGLSRFLEQDEARQVVVQALPGVPNRPETQAVPSRDLGPLLSGTAAMALASSGSVRAVQALVNEVRNEGPAANVAKAALIAYPPARLESILGDQSPSAAMAVLLGDLGDLRAIVRLRAALKSNDPKVQAASALALAKLGDADAAGVARSWSTNADPAAKLLAARILARMSPSEVPAILNPLLSSETQRAESVDIALEAPSPALGRALSAVVAQKDVDPELRERAIAALGRCGGAEAARTLQGLLREPDVAHAAALALANAPGDDASETIRNALRATETRSLALRIAVVRKLSLGISVSGIDDAIKSAAHGDDTARAAAAFAQVALGDREPDDPALLRDPALLPSVARGALARGVGSVAKLLPSLNQSASELRKAVEEIAPIASDIDEARRLDTARATRITALTARRDALGLALMAFPDGGSIPSATLRAWVEEGGAVAPLAMRALAARDEETHRARLLTLVESGDVQIRAHHALGLGFSREADAAGRLVSAYWFEPDARVRRAIVHALSHRTEPVREPMLLSAAQLDPDASVRALARHALHGAKLSDDTGGDQFSWISVSSRTPDSTPITASFRWERPEGLVVPTVPDPDGALLLPLLPSGRSNVSLARRAQVDLVRVAPASSASASASATPGLPPPGPTTIP